MAGVTHLTRYIWQVGDGSQIGILSIGLVPSSTNARMITPRNNIILSKVKDLISPITGTWDKELICEIFLAIDANRILSMPLSHMVFEDFVARGHTKNSMFSVSSAYHGEWKHQFNGNKSNLYNPGGSVVNKVWTRCWEARFQLRLKSLFGKLCNVFFPTMVC